MSNFLKLEANLEVNGHFLYVIAYKNIDTKEIVEFNCYVDNNEVEFYEGKPSCGCANLDCFLIDMIKELDQ